jgi:hypothetical protein
VRVVRTYATSTVLGALLLATVSGVAPAPTPQAHSGPAPEVEYLYDVTVRRHYNFPNNDALSYGQAICEKVGQNRGYPQVIFDVKSDVIPNDEYAASYLIANAVNLLCPGEIWHLRNSAARYRLPPDGD